jgi:HAD superfamily hydrolase (TIGR01509 family)
MSLTGVILDVDGTLVLSNDAHARAWVESFADFGYRVEYDRVRPLIGMGGDQIIPQFAPGLSDKDGIGKQIADRRKQLVIEKYSQNLAPAPGARQLILKMQSQGLHLFIASSATEQELSILLKAAQVEDLLSQKQATTSSDAEASKPEPDIVEAALKKSALSPQQVILIGDTPYDVESAKKTGVPTIAFRCGGFNDKQLQDAIAIYNDPSDLLSHYAQSPLGLEIREKSRS